MLYNTAPFAPSYPHDIPIIISVYPHDVQNFAWSKVSTVMALVSTVMAREYLTPIIHVITDNSIIENPSNDNP